MERSVSCATNISVVRGIVIFIFGIIVFVIVFVIILAVNIFMMNDGLELTSSLIGKWQYF